MSQKYIITDNKNQIKYSYFEQTLKSLKSHEQFPLIEKSTGFHFKFRGNYVPLEWEHIKKYPIANKYWFDVRKIFINKLMHYSMQQNECQQMPNSINKKCKYMDLGSTNITSDLDITFTLGFQTNQVIYTFNEIFFNLFKNSSAVVFDVNCYADPFFMILDETEYNKDISFWKNMPFDFYKYVKHNDKYFRMFIQPQSKVLVDKFNALQYEAILFKLKNAFSDANIPNDVSKLLENNNFSKIKTLCKEVDMDVKYIENDDFFTERINKYYKRALKINDRLWDRFILDGKSNPSYSQDEIDQQIYVIKKNLLLCTMISIEGYYSVGSFLSVIAYQQACKEQCSEIIQYMRQNPFNFLIAALENYADLIKHSGIGNESLINISKYIYRIHMIGTLLDSDIYPIELTKLIKEMYSYRQTKNGNQDDICKDFFTYMQIDEMNIKQLHEQVFKKICMPILNIINNNNNDTLSTNLVIAAMVTAFGITFL